MLPLVSPPRGNLSEVEGKKRELGGGRWTPPPVKPLLTGRTIHIDGIIDPSQ